MKHSRPIDVRTTDLPDGGLRIDLPDRKSGTETVGLVMMGPMLTVCGVLATVASIQAATTSGQLAVLTFLPVWAVGVVGGAYLSRAGLFGLLGYRRRIEITRGELRVVEQLGRLTRTRKRRLLQVHAFEVRPRKRSPYEPKSAPAVFVLEADCTPWKILLADQCASSVLASIGGRVREACRAAVTATGHEAPTMPVRVLAPLESEEPQAQPADSQHIADPTTGETTLNIPPLGFWHAPKESFIFCAIWLTLTSFFTYAGASGKMTTNDVVANLIFFLWMAVFWSIGLVVLNLALRVTFTRVVLSVKGSHLFLTRTGLFGAYHRHWRCVDIKEVDVGPSGLPREKGKPAIPEVQIQFKAGGRFGLLAGREEPELRWVVAALRQALETAERRDPHPTLDVLEQPAESRAILERTDAGFSLKVPALGFCGKIPWMGCGGLAVGLAASAGAWGVWTQAGAPWSWQPWVGLGVFSAVGLLALALALETVAFAFRRRILTVEGEVLTSWYTTWWGGIRKKEWSRSQLSAIDVGPLNPTGAFLILPQIQLHRRVGRPKRLMIYHDEEELLWIATILRQALRLPARAEPS